MDHLLVDAIPEDESAGAMEVGSDPMQEAALETNAEDNSLKSRPGDNASKVIGKTVKRFVVIFKHPIAPMYLREGRHANLTPWKIYSLFSSSRMRELWDQISSSGD